MNSQILQNRLKKEIMNLDRDPPPGVSCYPKEDDLTNLEAFINGPPDSPYEKGLFKLQVKIPQNYPFDPPQIRFLTYIYHPNIDDTGRICANILKKGEKGGWNPALNLSTTLLLLSQLLAQPNPDDPLDAEIAKEYQLDYPTFKQKAAEFTKKCASKDQVLSDNSSSQEKTDELESISAPEEVATEEKIEEVKKPKLSLARKKGSNQLSSQISSQTTIDPEPNTTLKRTLRFSTDDSQAFEDQGKQNTSILKEQDTTTNNILTKTQTEMLNSLGSDSVESSSPVESKDIDESQTDSLNLSPLITLRSIISVDHTQDTEPITLQDSQAIDNHLQSYQHSPISSNNSLIEDGELKSYQQKISSIESSPRIPLESEVPAESPVSSPSSIVHPTVVIDRYQSPKTRRSLKRDFDQTFIQQPNVILLSDDEDNVIDDDDDNVVFTLQLSRKRHRKKLSLQKRKNNK